MNILIVTLHYLNGVGGGVFASRAYINAFARMVRGKGKVTLLYPSSPNHPIEGIDDDVEAMPVDNNSSLLSKTFNLLTGRIHRNFTVLPTLLKKNILTL